MPPLRGVHRRADRRPAGPRDARGVGRGGREALARDPALATSVRCPGPCGEPRLGGGDLLGWRAVARRGIPGRRQRPIPLRSRSTTHCAEGPGGRLAADRRHPLNVVTTLTCRRLRILGPEEALDPETVKTKARLPPPPTLVPAPRCMVGAGVEGAPSHFFEVFGARATGYNFSIHPHGVLMSCRRPVRIEDQSPAYSRRPPAFEVHVPRAVCRAHGFPCGQGSRP